MLCYPRQCTRGAGQGLASGACIKSLHQGLSSGAHIRSLHQGLSSGAHIRSLHQGLSSGAHIRGSHQGLTSGTYIRGLHACWNTRAHKRSAHPKPKLFVHAPSPAGEPGCDSARPYMLLSRPPSCSRSDSCPIPVTYMGRVGSTHIFLDLT
eukprot:352471-Chlamydomonas_euryale.AAC.4